MDLFSGALALAGLWTIYAGYWAVAHSRATSKLEATRSVLARLEAEIGDLQSEKGHYARLKAELEPGTLPL